MTHTESEAFELIDTCSTTSTVAMSMLLAATMKESVMPFCGCWMEHQGQR